MIMRSTNFRWGGAFDLDRLLFGATSPSGDLLPPRTLRHHQSLQPPLRVLADWDFNIRYFFQPSARHPLHAWSLQATTNSAGSSSTIVDKEF